MKTIIFYSVSGVAPHQEMMIRHLGKNYQHEFALKLRLIQPGAKRLISFISIFIDALFRRNSTLYFSSFVSGSLAALAIFLKHKKVVYHSQDWIQDESGFLAKAERFVVSRAKVVIWNERNRATKISELSGRRNDVLIVPTYLPADFEMPDPDVTLRDKIASKAGVDPKQLVLIFAGGSYSASRLSQELVEAHKQLDSNTVLVFSGPQRMPAVVAKNPRCVDLGFLSYQKMLSCMAACDIGALLYDHAEAFGHRFQQPGRLTEYLRYGLRLIATRFPDADRLSEKSDACIVVDGYDVNELSSAIQTLVNSVRNSDDARASIKYECLRYRTYEPAADEAINEMRKMLAAC